MDKTSTASRQASEKPGSETEKLDPGEPLRIEWPVVLAEHDRWLRTIIYARLGEPEAVDEVLQEVSMAAVRQAAPIRDHSKVAPWLYRLAVTQCLLYRRTAGRRRKLTDRFAEDRRPVESDNREADPLGWLLADERRQLIRTAVARLPKRDAELLLLKYTEEWSYHDLADHLGLSESAIEARLHRARAKLRKELTSLDVTQ